MQFMVTEAREDPRLGDVDGRRLAVLALGSAVDELVEPGLGPIPDNERRFTFSVKVNGEVL